MATLDLVNINKIYPNGFQAVYDFNLHIDDEEFVVFVGPSGCGKSTTLRMIAGLEDITSGDLLIDGERMNDVAPKDRDIAMVFQSYALYPHMNVWDNMAFGLQLRHLPRKEINDRVGRAIQTLGLTQVQHRYPRELSGGQCQRVALGRAIVRNARLFLLDEPLSNLDAKLRVTMRGELIKLHKTLGCTTIYVTHDQTEAMTMGTRIVVMKDGRIQQVGTPREVYEKPNNIFVAGFIGTPPMNFIHGMLKDNATFVTPKGKFTFRIPRERMEIPSELGYENREVVLGIRPEDIYDNQNPEMMEKWAAYSQLDITAEIAELIGGETNVYTTIDGDQVVASVPCRDDIAPGQPFKIWLDFDHLHMFDPDTEEIINENSKHAFVEDDDLDI